MRTSIWTGLFTVVLLLGGCGGGGSDDGASPTETDTVGPNAGKTALAHAVMEDGRRVVLESFLSEGAVQKHAANPGDPAFRAALPTPCLAVVGIDGERRQCGSPFESDVDASGNPVVVDSIRAGAIAQVSDSAPLEIYGPTPKTTEIVMVDYELAGVRKRMRAVVLLAIDKERLQEAGFSDPFGFFFAELPPNAEHVSATAWSAGAEIGTVSFDRLIRSSHPQAFVEGRG